MMSCDPPMSYTLIGFNGGLCFMFSGTTHLGTHTNFVCSKKGTKSTHTMQHAPEYTNYHTRWLIRSRFFNDIVQ